MKKIETLFLRAHEVLYGSAQEKAVCAKTRTGQLVEPIVRPGCEWVLAGEGVATEKFDGTACVVIAGKLHARHEKKGEHKIKGWVHWSWNPGQHMGHGWRPVGEGPEDRWAREAWHENRFPLPSDGTYELVGPKVQGNPYDLVEHQLWRHGSRVVLNPISLANILDLKEPPPGMCFDAIKMWLEGTPVEGIVWHHPDGRMVKIKRRDYGLQWPIRRNRPKVSDAALDAMLEGSEPE